MTMVVLSVPPSANRMYRPAYQKHMVKSKEYKRWLDDSATLAGGWLNERLAVQTPLKVEIYANITRQRDLDNLIKPTLDMLQYADIVADDRYIDGIVAKRTDAVDRNMMLIGIEYLDE